MNWRHGTKTAVAGLALAAVFGLQPAEAEAHGRRGPGGRARAVRIVHGGGFYGFGFSPYFGYPFFDFGYGFGPYWMGYDRRPEGGLDPNIAMLAGWGAIDLDVKPGRAEVFVDGKFVAEARDLDGTPRFLWLPEGAHTLSVRKGGFLTFEAPVDVERGIVKRLKLRMKAGESQERALALAR